MRRLLAVVMLLAMLATAGCKINIDMTTTVLSGGEIDQEMVVKMEGLGDLNEDGVQPEGIAQAEDGWETEVQTEGDTVTVRSHKRLQPGEPMFPPGQVREDATEPEFNLEVVDLPDAKEYRLTMLAKPSQSSASSPQPTMEELDPDMKAFMEELAQVMAKMFKVTWTINLPGEVVETNADIRTEHGGTWEFKMDQSQETRTLRLVSREPKS